MLPVDLQQMFTHFLAKLGSYVGAVRLTGCPLLSTEGKAKAGSAFNGLIFFQPAVPKKPKRSVPVSSSVDRETGRIAAYAPLSREASDVMPTPAVRKTDVRTETQPNGSEVTTTIVEFTDPVGQLITRTQRTGKRRFGHTGCGAGASVSGSRDHGHE